MLPAGTVDIPFETLQAAFKKFGAPGKPGGVQASCAPVPPGRVRVVLVLKKNLGIYDRPLPS